MITPSWLSRSLRPFLYNSSVYSLVAQTAKICLQCGRPGFDPWVRKIPWRRKWQPTPVFLLGNPKDRGAWQSIAHGVAESDMTEQQAVSFSVYSFHLPWSLLLLLGLYYFCPLLCSSSHEMFLLYPQFSWRDLWSSPFCCFPLFLCIVHWRRPSYLFLLFSWALHSVGFIFPFLPCSSLLFFSQLFVKPPQTTTLPSCVSLSLV